MPDKMTDARSGNLAARDKMPPTALTAFLSVESNMSRRFQVARNCPGCCQAPWLRGLRKFEGQMELAHGHFLYQLSRSRLDLLVLSRDQLLNYVNWVCA